MLCKLFLQAHTLLTCFTAECLTLICKKEIHASYISWPSAGVLHLSTTFRVSHVWDENFTELRIAWTSFLYYEKFTAAQELRQLYRQRILKEWLLMMAPATCQLTGQTSHAPSWPHDRCFQGWWSNQLSSWQGILKWRKQTFQGIYLDTVEIRQR